MIMTRGSTKIKKESRLESGEEEAEEMNSHRESGSKETSVCKDSNRVIRGQTAEVSRIPMKTIRVVVDGDGFY